ncbi:MAG: hypothetical protein NT061_08790 [Spirochaetes bacterium]|nr:hypothetical protein [Spirochaetota bacterium]
MSSDKHLYLVLHPNHSLIASQLEPGQFVRHYVQGSSRYFEGRLIFAEMDPSFRHPYFDIEGAYKELIPHPDGSLKATKFIMSYRVLEHIDFDALGFLYFCNPSGEYLSLKSSTDLPPSGSQEFGIMVEVNPVRFMVLTRYDMMRFSTFITDPKNSKGAPAMFFTRLEFDIEDFVAEFDANPFLSSFVPGIHPARLHDAAMELKRTPGKQVKGISLDCPIDKISYKTLSHGFMFAVPGKTKFYPLLDVDTIEKTNYRFWKTM